MHLGVHTITKRCCEHERIFTAAITRYHDKYGSTLNKETNNKNIPIFPHTQATAFLEVCVHVYGYTHLHIYVYPINSLVIKCIKISAHLVKPRFKYTESNADIFFK